MASETDLRLALVKFLVATHRKSKPVLAIEAQYGLGRRRADLVMIGEHTHAFEIKSDLDTVMRLEGQLSEYQSTFDFVTVATTASQIQKVRSMTPKKVGLTLLSEGQIVQIRQASRNKIPSKENLVGSMSKAALLRYLPYVSKGLGLDEVKAKALRELTTVRIREAFMAELHSRFSESSQHFYDETDGDIREEDLLLLRRVSHLFSPPRVDQVLAVLELE
ncbi:MAG: sce7726 family protein [Paracoccaceae bacterium]